MQIASDRFFEQIQTNHRVFTYIDAVGPNKETLRLTGVSGDVQVDRTADIRRRMTAVVVDPTGVLSSGQAGTANILTPYGTDLYPYRGVQYSDGTTEVVPLGVFRLAKVTVDDSANGLTIGLEAYDHSRVVARDKFTSPYTVNATDNIVGAIQAILAMTFADLTYDIMTTSRTVGITKMYDIGADPWAACRELAMGVGFDLYFDVQGRVVIAPPVDIAAPPSAVWSYTDGSGGLVKVSKTITDDPGINGVVVTGESLANTIAPVRALVWDVNPSSPTYYLGPYGQVPMFVSDQTVATAGDALDTATQLLQNQLGATLQVSIDVIPNPAFEAGDIIYLQRSKSAIDSKFSLDAFNVPFGADGTQTLTLRQKQLG